MYRDDAKKKDLFFHCDVNFLVIAVFLLYACVQAVVKYLDIQNPYLFLCVVQFLIYVLPCAVYLMIKRQRINFHRKKSFDKNVFFFTLASLFTLISLSALLKYFSVYALTLSKDYNNIYTGASSPVYILLSGVVIPAITEEILIRGVVLHEYRKSFNTLSAVGISALIFSFLHFSPENMAVLFGAGILLGIVSVVTESILPAIILHMANNFVNLFTDSILNDFATESRGGIFALIVFLCIFIVFFIIFLYRAEKIYLHRALTRDVHDDETKKSGNILKVIISPAFIAIAALFLIISAV